MTLIGQRLSEGGEAVRVDEREGEGVPGGWASIPTLLSLVVVKLHSAPRSYVGDLAPVLRPAEVRDAGEVKLLLDPNSPTAYTFFSLSLNFVCSRYAVAANDDEKISYAGTFRPRLSNSFLYPARDLVELIVTKYIFLWHNAEGTTDRHDENIVLTTRLVLPMSAKPAPAPSVVALRSRRPPASPQSADGFIIRVVESLMPSLLVVRESDGAHAAGDGLVVQHAQRTGVQQRLPLKAKDRHDEDDMSLPDRAGGVADVRSLPRSRRLQLRLKRSPWRCSSSREKMSVHLTR